MMKGLKIKMFDRLKEKYNTAVNEKYRDSLTSFDDLIGDDYEGMSGLFYLYNRRYLHWLSNDPDEAIKQGEVRFRRLFYKLLQKIGPGMLKCAQVIENRRQLEDPSSKEQDDPVVYPDRPVIFVSNHGFYDDALASSLAAGRPAWFFWGSLPLLYNTFNGFASALVGAVVVNRKHKASRAASVSKSLKVMEFGWDVIVYPEGGWNKTPEKPVLDLWRGVYTLSCEAKCAVVPVVHFIRDMEILRRDNAIHTVVDDPIPLYEMEEKEALTYLRDTLASWWWKMAEKYGRSTREAEMSGFSSPAEKWEAHLEKRMKHVDRYDSTSEKIADFRPKEKELPQDVFRPLADVTDITAKNARLILYAKHLVTEAVRSDFQRRF